MKTIQQPLPPIRYFIIHRTGGVYSTLEGVTTHDAAGHCQGLNASDECGTSEIHAEFHNKWECREEFNRLSK